MNASTTARRTASSRTAAAKPQTRPAASKTAKSAPKPQPVATIDLGARQVRYWFPVATLSDGSKVSCSHTRYGHESEAAAKRCMSALIASKGHKAA